MKSPLRQMLLIALSIALAAAGAVAIVHAGSSNLPGTLAVPQSPQMMSIPF